MPSILPTPIDESDNALGMPDLPMEAVTVPVRPEAVGELVHSRDKLPVPSLDGR